MTPQYASLQGPWLAFVVKEGNRTPLAYFTHTRTPEGLKRIPWTESTLVAALNLSRRHLPVSLLEDEVIVLEDNPKYEPAGLKG